MDPVSRPQSAPAAAPTAAAPPQPAKPPAEAPPQPATQSDPADQVATTSRPEAGFDPAQAIWGRDIQSPADLAAHPEDPAAFNAMLDDVIAEADASIAASQRQQEAELNRLMTQAVGKPFPDLQSLAQSLTAQANQADTQALPGDLLDFARSRFGELDRDHDQLISRRDLAMAMSNPLLRGRDAMLLATMVASMDDLMAFSSQGGHAGISLQDMEAYAASARSQPGQAAARRIADRFATARDHLQSTITQLYATPDNPSQSIRLDAGAQGMIGDCYFLSALAGLAERQGTGSTGVGQPRGAEAIARMIQDNRDGTYTVRFPGREAIRVTRPTEAEIALGATAGANGLWLSILEKAYAHRTNQDAATNLLDMRLPTDMAADQIDGGTLGQGIQAVTNRPVNEDWMTFTGIETTRERLREAMRNERVVTAAVLGSGSAGLPGGHAYTVVAYDRDSDTITLRNPWGHTEPGSDGRNDGTFRMTLTQFYQHFSQLAYEH